MVEVLVMSSNWEFENPTVTREEIDRAVEVLREVEVLVEAARDGKHIDRDWLGDLELSVSKSLKDLEATIGIKGDV